MVCWLLQKPARRHSTADSPWTKFEMATFMLPHSSNNKLMMVIGDDDHIIAKYLQPLGEASVSCQEEIPAPQITLMMPGEQLKIGKITINDDVDK